MQKTGQFEVAMMVDRECLTYTAERCGRYLAYARQRLWHNMAENLNDIGSDGREYDMTFRFVEEKVDHSGFIPQELEHEMGRDKDLRIEYQVALRHYEDAQVGEHATLPFGVTVEQMMVAIGCRTFRLDGGMWKRIE